MKKQPKCNKKPFDTKNEAKGVLNAILKRNSKNPWRDEISVYQCDLCDKFHVSSKADNSNGYVPNKIKEKTYFDIQKEKWGSWLQNYASKGAVINQHNKKYST